MWHRILNRAFWGATQCCPLAGALCAATPSNHVVCKSEADAEGIWHMPPVRVLQYNVECDTQDARKPAYEMKRPIWPQRQYLVRDVIKDQSPDLIGFQETVPHQCVDLQNLLEKEGYDVEFAVFGSLTYALKLRGAGPLAGWRITQRGDSQFYSPLHPRCFLWVALEGPNDGRLLFVVTHYHHPTDEEGERTREASSRQLIAFLQSPRWRDWPQIVVGDFNAEPGAMAHSALVNDSSLVDSYAECHPREPRRPITFHKYLGKSFEPPAKWAQTAWPPSLGPGSIKSCHIDWVLHSRSLKALSCDILSDYNDASDHFPVLAVMQANHDIAPEAHAACANAISDVEALERLWCIACEEFWVMDKSQYDFIKELQSKDPSCSIGRQLLRAFERAEFESKKANHPSHETHMFAASYLQLKCQLLKRES